MPLFPGVPSISLIFLCSIVSAPSVAGARTTSRPAAMAQPERGDLRVSSASVRGVVLDPDSRPAPGVRVVLDRDAASDIAHTTDAKGRFAFEHLDAAHYELRAFADGFAADALSLTLQHEETQHVTVRLRVSPINESMVVSASHVARPRSSLGDSVTLFTDSELRARQINGVAGALRLVPGLTVAQSGGHGSVTSLFPRGGESNYTLVLVDGVRVNDFGSAFDFAHLGVASVERVEVVRGPQSALFGSDAIGGVVQVVTKRGGPLRGVGSYEHGRFDTGRLALDAAGSLGAWSWGGGGERLSSDGFTGTPRPTAERVSNDDYTRTTLSGTGGYQTRRHHVTLVGHWGRNERGFPGPYGSDPNDTYGGVDRISRGKNDTHGLALTASRSWNRALQTRGDVSTAARDSDFVSPFGASTSENRLTSARLQADYVATTQLGFSGGAETQFERAASSFITGHAEEPVDVERRVTGVFGELRWTAARVSLTAGLRGEHFRRERLEGNDDPFEPRPDFAADTRTSLSPKLAVTYLAHASPATWTRLRASTGTGIRPPDAFEIAFTDNPALKPERSRSADVGIEHGLASGRLIVDVAAFVNRYDDLLVTVGRSFQDASQFRTDNVSNARVRGLELSVAARPSAALTVRAGYTWLDTAILAVDGTSGEVPSPFNVGDALLRRPRHRSFLDLVYSAGRLVAFARLDARGEALDVDPTNGAFGGTFIAPGYASADLGASVALLRGVEVLARVTNLLDREYEEILGFPALGRSVTVGVRLGIGTR
ncbi:MAG: TonB-dependent receptor [Luteitalea sp.]|nr:TonB-dependent receptor [Luteitalea sp.]